MPLFALWKDIPGKLRSQKASGTAFMPAGKKSSKVFFVPLYSLPQGMFVCYLYVCVCIFSYFIKMMLLLNTEI